MPIPLVTARSGGEQTTDSTTHVVTLPSFTTGQLLLVTMAIDARVTATVSSGSGWNQLGRIPNGTVTLVVFWKIASGTGDNLTITTDVSQQSVHNSWAISGGYYVDGDPSQRTDGLCTSITPVDRWDADYLSIVGMTANGVVSGLSAPSGYSNTVLRTPAGSDNATLITAELAYSNITTSLSSATFTGAGIPLTFNCPTFHIAISESDPYVTGHARVYSREVTDFSATTQTSYTMRMPPNIENGDLLVSLIAVNSSTSSLAVDYTASGGWYSWDGTETHVTHSSRLVSKIADGNDALMFTTSSALKGHGIVACIKNWSRVIESGTSNGWFKIGAETYNQPYLGLSPTWKKLTFFRSIALANSYWFDTGTNPWTGFPQSASGSGASVGWGELGLGLDNGIDWGSITTSENATIHEFAIEGKHINTVEFIGYRGSSFAGTTSNQTVSISTVLNTSGGSVSVRPGDIVIVGYASASTSNQAINVVTSGYTQIDTKRYVDGTTYDVNMGMWYKVMGDTPDTSVVMTGTLNTADAGAIQVQVYRGIDQTNPIDGVTFTSGTGTTLPQPLPLDYVMSGGLPIQFVAMASVSTAGSLVPGINNYYVTYNANDTNSITSTMNHSVPDGVKRFIPSAFTGGPTAAAGNSWGAYTLNLKPRDNIANTYSWNHEAGTINTISYRSSSVLFTSHPGVKRSQGARITANNYGPLYYTEQIQDRQVYVQARVNIIVGQNPSADATVGVLGLYNYYSNTNVYQNLNVQADIKTNGSIFYTLFHNANNLSIPCNTAFSSNTWNYVSFFVDYNDLGDSGRPMIFKVNNQLIGSANIYPPQWKFHALVGKNYVQSGAADANTLVFLDDVKFSALDWPAYPTGRPKIYNGSTWVNKPLMRWNGSAWVEEPMYYYNGTNWEYVT
jgi:hypothetical protein